MPRKRRYSVLVYKEKISPKKWIILLFPAQDRLSMQKMWRMQLGINNNDG